MSGKKGWLHFGPWLGELGHSCANGLQPEKGQSDGSVTQEMTVCASIAYSQKKEAVRGGDQDEAAASMVFATNRKLAASLSGGQQALERLMSPVEP